MGLIAMKNRLNYNEKWAYFIVHSICVFAHYTNSGAQATGY